MILKSRSPFFTLPEPVDLSVTSLRLYPAGDPEQAPGSHAIQMYRIPLREIMRMRQDGNNADGIPTYYAIEGDSTRVEIWPTPARDFYARFRYAPALKEI